MNKMVERQLKSRPPRVERVSNELMEMVGDKPYYIFTAVVRGWDKCVYLVKANGYNYDNIPEEKEKYYAFAKYCNFEKLLEDEGNEILPIEEYVNCTFEKTPFIDDVPVKGKGDGEVYIRFLFFRAEETKELSLYDEEVDEEWQHIQIGF